MTNFVDLVLASPLTHCKWRPKSDCTGRFPTTFTFIDLLDHNRVYEGVVSLHLVWIVPQGETILHVSLNREKLLIHFFHPAILNSIFYMHAKSRDHSTRGSSCVHMLGVSNTLWYDGIIYIQDLSKLSFFLHLFSLLEKSDITIWFYVKFWSIQKKKIKNALFVTILQRLFQKLPQKSNFLKHLSFQ